jgi:hypothetical protein
VGVGDTIGGYREPTHAPTDPPYAPDGDSGEHDEGDGEHDEGDGEHDEGDGSDYTEDDYTEDDYSEDDYSEDDYSGEDGVRREDGGAGGVPQRPVQVARGMVLVGVEDSRELMKRAKGQGADFLIVFDITLRPSTKTPIVQNDTRIYLYCVATGEKIHTTAKLNNVEVQRARQGGDDGGVIAEIEELFEAVDQRCLIRPMPKLLPKHAEDRVDSLTIDKQYRNPIPVLAEIRMYHTRGLLDAQQLQEAYGRILGNQQAAALALGSEEARRDTIVPWLPRGYY